MIELIFLACLTNAPTECKEQSRLFTDITPMTCMLGAPALLAEWVNHHPGWRIERWKCRSADTRQTEA